MRKVNRKRKAKRFESDFGGEKYLAYIHSLPCDVCGVEGYTVAAHLRSRGAGGKADVLAPLCHTRHETRPTTVPGWVITDWVEGCHELYDAHDAETRAHEPRLRKLAAQRHKQFHEKDEAA